MKKTVSFLALFLVVSILFSGVSAYYHTDRSPDWNDGYEEGYNKGYDSGESWGYEDGKSDGYSEGYTDGYDQGKNIAANKGEKESRALKEELQGANSQLRIYKNATVWLGFLSAALVLGAAGYYFFVIKRKKLGFFKAETKAAETSPSVTNPAPPIKPSSSNSAKPARIVRARAVKRVPAPAASLTRPGVSAAAPDSEQTPPAPLPAENRSHANPKEGKPDLAEEIHKRAKDLGLGMKWFDFLRGHFWGPALTFAAINALGILSLASAMTSSSVRILSIVPFVLYLSNILLYVNLFNSLIDCSYLVPAKWTAFCSFNLITVAANLFIVSSDFSLNNFTYYNITGMVLTAIAFIPNMVYFGKRKKLFD